MILLKKKKSINDIYNKKYISCNVSHSFKIDIDNYFCITHFFCGTKPKKKKKSLISHNPFTLTLLKKKFITLLKSYIKKKKQILHPVIINVEQW